MGNSAHDKALQRAVPQRKRREIRRLASEPLHKTGRTDPIGYGRDCLIRPLHGGREEEKPAAGQGERPGKGPRPEGRRGKATARREDKAASGAPGKNRYGKAVSGGKTAAGRAGSRGAERPGKAPARSAGRGSSDGRRGGSRGNSRSGR